MAAVATSVPANGNSAKLSELSKQLSAEGEQQQLQRSSMEHSIFSRGFNILWLMLECSVEHNCRPQPS